MKLKLFLIFSLSLIILLMSVNTHLPFEQDQGGKAAKIILMVRTNTIFQPTTTESIYNDALLSFYYIVSSLLYKILGGEIFLFMNILSVIMGAIFFTIIAILLKIVLNFDPITSWFIFINMPILTTTFTYGNEVAFSLTFFSLSLLFFSLRIKGNWLFSVLFLCFSILSRPDILLMIPFWLAWVLNFSLSGYKVHEKFFIMLNCVTFGLLVLIVYFVFFIHHVNYPSTAIDGWVRFNTNIKLLISYLSYPFNISIVLISGLGFIYIVRQNRKLAVILLLLVFPLIFYVWNLTSPKYIISLTFLFGIASIYFVDLSKKKGKIIVFGFVAIWFFISVSPFGIFPFKEGAGIIIPTADGAIPSGSFIWFFQNAKNGFYQQKYKSEIESFRQALYYLDAIPNNQGAIVGSFNTQFAYLELSLSDHYVELKQWVRQNVFLKKFPDENKSRYLLLQRTYLSINKMDPQIKNLFLEYLKMGRIKAISSESDPFPLVIEVGDSIPFGQNVELSDRILFATGYYKDNGFLQSDTYYKYYRPTYWVKSECIGGNQIFSPFYKDSQWSMYSQSIEGGQLWMLELPIYYLGERNPGLVDTRIIEHKGE